MKSPQSPSIGRIVRFVLKDESIIELIGQKEVAAIITKAPAADDPNSIVSLTAFMPGMNPITLETIPYSEENAVCTWHWPPRD